MNTLLKALLWTIVLIVAIIGIPILIGLIGVMWPVLLIIALIVFIPLAIGIAVGKNDKGDH
ncbi:MAG: hypothetical protein J6U54_08530 [Clostridiales bacterium]|nr:hypothetical protein [Clostridiales bacterium]